MLVSPSERSLRPTVDPYVWIEEERVGYVRYVSGDRRWEVWGECCGHGSCQVGAAADDAGWLPRTGRLDIPVGPGFVCNPCTTHRLIRIVEA